MLDQDYQLIYGDSMKAELCKTLENKGEHSGIKKCNDTSYGIAEAQSNVLGWHYYVLTDVEMGQSEMRFSVWMLTAVALLCALAFWAANYIIYHPIRRLLKDVSDADGSMKDTVVGNEFEYIAGSFHHLKQGQYELQMLLNQQRDRLTELFQLRLIHGEVNAEEWEEYRKDLNLQHFQCFVTIVVVLDMKEDNQSSISEDEVALLDSIREFHEHFQEYTKRESDNQETCRFYLTSSTVKEKEYDRQFENKIQEGIKAIDKQMCYHVADNFSVFLKADSLPSEQTAIYILRFVDAIMLTAIDAGIQIEDVYPDGIKKYYRELMEVTEPDRERRYIKKNFIDPIIQARTDYLEKNSNSILDDIIHLIEEKEGNISLTECAEILGVSQTYIWKLLKMERDKSFLDYVEEYKLKQAKHMLLNTTMSVAEIAEKLNYTNAQNFIRFFSKNVGVTPGKFRKLY